MIDDSIQLFYQECYEGITVTGLYIPEKYYNYLTLYAYINLAWCYNMYGDDYIIDSSNTNITIRYFDNMKTISKCIGKNFILTKFQFETLETALRKFRNFADDYRQKEIEEKLQKEDDQRKLDAARRNWEAEHLSMPKVMHF